MRALEAFVIFLVGLTPWVILMFIVYGIQLLVERHR